MRKVILAIALQIACISMAFSQTGYERFFKEYESIDGVESFSLSTSLFRFMLDDKKKEKDADEMLKKIDGISFLVADSAHPQMGEIQKALRSHLPKKKYKKMMEIKDGSSTISFKARGTKKKIDEILLTVMDEDSLFVMCISGNFSLEDAKSLMKSVDVNKAKGGK